MKKIFYIFAFILAHLTTVSSQNFSGVIQFETENAEVGETAKITCYIKATKCKMEIQSSSKEGNGSYVLFFDDQTSDVIMLSGGTRTVIPMAGLSENKYLQNIWFTAETGKTQNIAGYESKEVQLKSTSSTIECFVASTLNIQFPVVLNTRGIMRTLKNNNINGTPVSIVVKDLNGNLLFSQKIVSVSSQNLADGIFTE